MFTFITGSVVGFIAGVIVTFLFSRKNKAIVSQVNATVTAIDEKIKASK